MDLPLSLCNENEINAPKHFNILSEGDKEKYLHLNRYIFNSDKRYKRYKKIESLRDALYLVHLYCIRNDSDDWKRCFVCGIYWYGNDIAINTRQLSQLICKCKSSINGALSEMGYVSFPSNEKLIAHMPFLNGNSTEQKQ